MPLARITEQGLAAIAVSVALLWGCFIGERLLVRDALAHRAQVMRELNQMKRSHPSQPVSTPAPNNRHASPVALG